MDAHTWHDTPDSPPVTLTGHQIKQALEFLAPDGTDDQLESELTICHGQRMDDAGQITLGMKCWLTDYPDEGIFPLDDIPPHEHTPETLLHGSKKTIRDALQSACSVLEAHVQICKIMRTEPDNTVTEALGKLKSAWQIPLYPVKIQPLVWSGMEPADAVIPLPHIKAKTPFATLRIASNQLGTEFVIWLNDDVLCATSSLEDAKAIATKAVTDRVAEMLSPL